MNRKQRRDRDRRQRRMDDAIHAAMAASEADGRPWHVYGMTHACRDCGADASMHGNGRDGQIIAHIYHDEGCPAARGVTPWSPVPL